MKLTFYPWARIKDILCKVTCLEENNGTWYIKLGYSKEDGIDLTLNAMQVAGLVDVDSQGITLQEWSKHSLSPDNVFYEDPMLQAALDFDYDCNLGGDWITPIIATTAYDTLLVFDESDKGELATKVAEASITSLYEIAKLHGLNWGLVSDFTKGRVKNFILHLASAG